MCGDEHLHSATGLVLPGTSNAPPMETMRPIFDVIVRESLRMRRARFVKGPKATYVMVLGGYA